MQTAGGQSAVAGRGVRGATDRSPLRLEFNCSDFGSDDENDNLIELGVTTDIDFWLADKREPGSPEADAATNQVTAETSALNLTLLRTVLDSIVTETGGQVSDR